MRLPDADAFPRFRFTQPLRSHTMASPERQELLRNAVVFLRDPKVSVQRSLTSQISLH